MATQTSESRVFEAKLRVQIRFWSRIAAAVVMSWSIMMALWSDEHFRWVLVGLDVLWAAALILGASRGAWLVVAAAISVVQLSLFGWASAGTYILLVAAFAMRLPPMAAAVSTGALSAATAIGIVWVGDSQPPGYEMRARDLLFAAANMFFIGALMRSALVSWFRAEWLATQLHAAHDMLRRDLATNEALAAAQERTRIAHELHDNLGHSLATAHVHTQLARRLARQVEDAADSPLLHAIDQVGESTRRAMHELRDAVSLLRHRGDAGTLGARMRAMLARLPDTVLAHEVAVVGEERVLPPAAEFAIYRALQEAMTNVVKHARAHAVSVRLEYTPACVRLEVVDDGAGTAVVLHGFGLRGIAERLQAVGGRLDVSSTLGQGFCLRVEVDAA